MKHLFFLLALLTIGNCSAQWSNTMAADVVLGQYDFDNINNGTTDTTMYLPYGVAVDPTTGKVFISDAWNHRILRWSSTNAAITGSPAEAVLGQPDFSSSSSSTTQNGLDKPWGIFVDATGTLWVADKENNRVLRFDNASTKTNGANADGVLGQASFTTDGGNTTQNGLYNPRGVTVDAAGRLYVADYSNSRVLRFDNAAAKSNGANADGLLGQSSYTSFNGSHSISVMGGPSGVVVDNAGNLFVAEEVGRVTRWDNAAAKPNGASADGLLGQGDFDYVNTVQQTTQNGMSRAVGVAIDDSGTLFVAEPDNHRVLIFLNAASKGVGANADYVLGQLGFTSANAGCTQTIMRAVTAVALDPAGKLWVVNQNNYRALRISPMLTSVEEQPQEKDHLPLVFPNPVSDAAIIQFYASASEEVNMVLYDVTGVKLWEHLAIAYHSGINQIPLNAANLPHGIYIVALAGAERVEWVKVVVE